MDTDMQKQVRESTTIDKGTKEFFLKMKADNALVDPFDSALKLLKLLYEGKPFDNGAHIDYYEV
jgi:hypothetical protein